MRVWGSCSKIAEATVTFCTFFKKITGKQFFTFIAGYQVESASRMLQKIGMSVGEICHRAGFNDVPYFNRMFKKIKLVTPTKFRESHPLAKELKLKKCIAEDDLIL